MHISTAPTLSILLSLTASTHASPLPNPTSTSTLLQLASQQHQQSSTPPTPLTLPSTNGNREMLSHINTLRKAQSLPLLTWSPLLAENAYQTGAATDGKTLRHKSHAGTTFGQVLTLGFSEEDACARNLKGYTPFELFYTSWLCEVPGDKALQGKCPEVLSVSRINVRGQRGHYDLLSGKGARKIGCAFFRGSGAKKCGSYTGIWACDLGR